MNKTTRKNKDLLIEYLKSVGKGPDDSGTTEKKKSKPRRGRPVERTDRPPNSKTRTLPGESRYRVTLRDDQIKCMKYISELKGVTIREAYQEAVENYINRAEN